MVQERRVRPVTGDRLTESGGGRDGKEPVTAPEVRHREALAELDRQIEGLALVKTLSDGQQVVAKGTEPTVTTIRGLEGRKRILQRHAPKWSESRGQWSCAGDTCYAGYWPCPDWRDAAGRETSDG